MKAMILAAGFGSRLLPYTRYKPKPLFTFAGRAILDIIISRLQSAGCNQIIINTHHLHLEIEAFIASKTHRITGNQPHSW
jgi:NDP-sugar pyrophosphorylase family protein